MLNRVKHDSCIVSRVKHNGVWSLLSFWAWPRISVFNYIAVIPNLIWNLSSIRNTNLNLYLFGAEMLNQVQHDGCVMSRVKHDEGAEVFEATFVYRLFWLELIE